MKTKEEGMCPSCQGSGKCHTCEGAGHIHRILPTPIPVISGTVRREPEGGTRRNCPKCMGSGTCQSCHGTGKTS